MIQAGLVAAYWEVEDREAWRGPASLDPLLRDLFDRQEEGLYEHLRDWGVVPVRRHHLLPAARGVLGVLLGTFYPETWRLLLQGLASRREVPLQTPRGEVRLRRVALDPRHHPHLGQLDEEAFYRPRPLVEPVTLRTWSPLRAPRGILGALGDLQEELAERFDHPDLLPQKLLGDWTLRQVRLRRDPQGDLRGAFELTGSHPYAWVLLEAARMRGLGEGLEEGLGALDTPLPPRRRNES